MSYFQRNVFNQILNSMPKERIHIILGTRQIGKTTMLKQLQEYYEQKDMVCAYFSMEMPSHLELFSLGYENIIDYLRRHQMLHDTKPTLLLLDEIQYIPSISHTLKACADFNPSIHVIATGSSSLEIRKHLDEPLVGRKRTITMYPLTFDEYLVFRKSPLAPVHTLAMTDTIGQSTLNEYVKHFQECMLWGGMPRIALEDNCDERRILLNEIYTTYLEKDIKGILRNEHVPSFNMFLKIVASHSGVMINTERLAQMTQQTRVRTQELLFILEQTFVNRLVAPFCMNKQKELVKHKKTFFYDTGIRNQSMNDFSPLMYRHDKGSILETAVCNEIIKHMSVAHELYYYRTRNNTEIDFILKKDANIYPIEVKAGSTRTIPKAFYEFIKTYHVQKAFVLNTDQMHIAHIGRTDVYFVPYFFAGNIPALISENCSL